MAKFSKIVQGTQAEKPTEIPPVDGGDKLVDVLLRPLDAIAEEDALYEARQRAISKGIIDPKPGEPIYDMALMVETISRGYLDVDSPKEKREPYFDGGADDVRNYGREAIHYLYQLHQTWQDEVSPTISKLDAKQTIEAMIKIGAPNEREARSFLERCRPGLLVSLLRSMGILLFDSLTGSSSSGKNSASATESSKSDTAS